MTALSQLLMDREWGLPNARSRIREEIERNIADNLANDRFNYEVIKLPEGFRHNFYQGGDFVAVLSEKVTDEKVQKLALWSLRIRCKLWETEVTENVGLSECIVSDSGMVLLKTFRSRKIFVDGELSGELPNSLRNCDSIFVIGERILGVWTKYHPTNAEIPVSSFYEWNKEGTLLRKHQLSYIQREWDSVYACNERFWVRLSGSTYTKVCSIIEVFDRVMETFNKFELSDDERFSSACIVQNRLFCGKGSMKNGEFTPTICSYHLANGLLVEEFTTRLTVLPKELVANESYVAWIDIVEGLRGVKYLDISTKTIKTVFCSAHYPTTLNIIGTLLSINDDFRSSRKIIDMTNGENKCDVQYKAFLDRPSFSNGNVLIIGPLNNQMYIESFVGEGLSHQKSPFREIEET